MVRNEARRTALLDAAIDVLAEEGARGLTYRAIDAKAEVPAGTASNYFANRDELMAEVSTSYLAMMELRLEATRRPELRTALTKTFAANLDFNISFNEESKLPGDRMTVLLMYFGMTGLIYERLTLPGVVEPMDLDQLIEVLVDRAIGPA